MGGYSHIPVMLPEVLAMLQPHSAGRYADGTVGGAGHAAAILQASSPDGWLYGCDQDHAAMEAAELRLAPYAGRFELRRENFGNLAQWIEPASCDGVLLDLGLSSHQLNEAGRGFSFQQDGPLDMRQDQRQALTASELVNTASVEDLARIFWEWGGERQSRRIARAIDRERRVRCIEGTLHLAGLVERVAPRRGRRTHPATRVFQALRMAVNRETERLRQGLEAATRILKPGGRLLVITFHSLEDQMVKRFGRERCRDYTVLGEIDAPEFRQARPPEMRWVERKALLPSAAEVAANPQSRSAQLRVLQKI